MAVIALSSSNRKHKCWINRIDEVHAVTAIKFMYEQVKTPIGMRAPPLFLLGASSGGAFVGTFSHDARTFGLVVSAICVQIMFRRIHREESSFLKHQKCQVHIFRPQEIECKPSCSLGWVK